MTILQSIGCWVLRFVYRTTSYSAWKNVALPGDVIVKSTEIPLEGRSLPATIFVPSVEKSTDQKLRPLIVYFHGGGMCGGNSATSHYYCNVVFASLLKCISASDPRKCPQGQYATYLLATAEYDILRDEGKALGDKMKKAGAPVEHKHYIAEHGFMCTDGKKEQFEECLRDLESWMAKL